MKVNLTKEERKWIFSAYYGASVTAALDFGKSNATDLKSEENQALMAQSGIALRSFQIVYSQILDAIFSGDGDEFEFDDGLAENVESLFSHTIIAMENAKKEMSVGDADLEMLENIDRRLEIFANISKKFKGSLIIV